LVRELIKTYNPISHLPTLVNKPFSIYFQDSPDMNESYHKNIFALKSEAKMQQYYEELRKNKENFKKAEAEFQTIDVVPIKKSFKEKVDESECNFLAKLEEFGKNNIFAAKRKKFCDYSNNNLFDNIEYFQKKRESSKMTPIQIKENSDYAGFFFYTKK